MFVAPFVVTSKNNFGEARPITVTKVEKLFTSMKIKNMKKEIRIDDATYAGFLKTIWKAFFITGIFIV